MNYLTVDQSFTATAWIYWEDDEVVSWNVIHSDKELTKYERAELIAKELVKVINEYEPQRVIIEQLAFGGFGNATRDLAGLLYTIIISIKKGTHLTYSDVQFVTATGAKKALTGSGKATKQDMFAAVPEDIRDLFQKKFKKSNGVYDLCDAYGFGKWFQEVGIIN